MHNTGRSWNFGVLSLVVLTGIACCFGGCLIGSSTRTDVQGRMVSPAEVASIQPGVTTEQEVISKLGPASTTTQLSDGSVLHSWTATRTERRSGAMFLIFTSSSEKTERTTLSVTCKDGIVRSVGIS